MATINGIPPPYDRSRYPRGRDAIQAAARDVLAVGHDLGPWERGEPGAEAVPLLPYVPWLRRVGWPCRTVQVEHQRRLGHRVVNQTVIVFPAVLLADLAARLGLGTGKRFELEW